MLSTVAFTSCKRTLTTPSPNCLEWSPGVGRICVGTCDREQRSELLQWLVHCTVCAIGIPARRSRSADATRLVPGAAIRAVATSQSTVDVPVTQFDCEALATLSTAYVSPADLLAATWASFGMRVVQHSPHLILSHADGEFVLAVGTPVVDVHVPSRTQYSLPPKNTSRSGRSDTTIPCSSGTPTASPSDWRFRL